MGYKNSALVIPPAALKDEQSVEAIRAWVADGGLHCSLNVAIWDEVGNWGILLADVARHVANAQYELNGKDREESVRQIRLLFEAELDSPTDTPKGGFV